MLAASFALCLFCLHTHCLSHPPWRHMASGGSCPKANALLLLGSSLCVVVRSAAMRHSPKTTLSKRQNWPPNRPCNTGLLGKSSAPRLAATAHFMHSEKSTRQVRSGQDGEWLGKKQKPKSPPNSDSRDDGTCCCSLQTPPGACIVASRILAPGPPVRREAKKRTCKLEELGGQKRALTRLPLKDNVE